MKNITITVEQAQKIVSLLEENIGDADVFFDAGSEKDEQDKLSNAYAALDESTSILKNAIAQAN